MRKRGWVWAPKRVSALPAGEKFAIIAACDKFVAEVLKPRFLSEIRLTEFNHPVDIYGKWHRQWWRLYHLVSLKEALCSIEQDGRLHPL